MIHVCYSLSDYSGHYCNWTATSMLSMFENTREQVTVHLFTDSTLTLENRNKLVQLCDQYKQKIKFYDAANLAKDWWDKYKQLKTWKTFRPGIGSAYRLGAPMFLPDDIHKLIFIDSDIVVDVDVKELWDFDIKGNPIAGVSLSDMGTDSAKNDRIFMTGAISSFKEYMNSGTLILDLDLLRKEGRESMISNCLEILREHIYIDDLLDERTLSILYLNRYFHLPRKYNCMVGLYRGNTKNFKRGIMWHFAGSTMLSLNAGDPWNSLFLSYFIKTPFCTPETFENLFNECTRIFEESKDSVNQRLETIHKSLQLNLNRKPMFLVSEKLVDDAEKSFGKKNLSPRIVLKNETSIEILKYMISHLSDKHVFYIYIESEKYPEIRDKLTDAGFIENQNFFNGKELFSPATKRLPASSKQFAIM